MTPCTLPPSLIVSLLVAVLLPRQGRCEGHRTGNNIQYNWAYEYAGRDIPLSMGILFTRGWQNMQSTYKRLPHSHEKWYSRFVLDDPYVEDFDLVAELLEDLARKNSLCPAQVALSFVQSFPHDYHIGSYQRFGSEALIDLQGDCSDKSVLLASILRALGHECVFLESPGHLQLGVKEKLGEACMHGEYYTYNGFRYYVAETTADGPIGASTDVNEATIVPAYKRPGSIQGTEYHTPCEVCHRTGMRSIGRGEHADTVPCHRCSGKGWY